MSKSSIGLSNNLVLSLGVGLAAIGSASYFVYKKFKSDEMPTKWRRVGKLECVNIFPVKSCAPLQVTDKDELWCDVLGLQLKGVLDRTLMLVDSNNKMITARIYPKMVLIQPKLLSETRLIFSAPGMPDLDLDFATLKDEAPGKDIHTSVWGANLNAMLCGPRFDAWFSEYILGEDEGLHLVYYPYPKPVRPTNHRLLKEPFIKQEDSGTFNDATSYMLMNLASVGFLNKQLERPVDALQFRGNFELKMDVDEPHVENSWNWIRIGEDAVFRVVAPCTRCILPNINPSSGERDPDGNPLKTLNMYRRFPNYSSPVLGIHLGLRHPGAIKRYDDIYVEDA